MFASEVHGCDGSGSVGKDGSGTGLKNQPFRPSGGKSLIPSSRAEILTAVLLSALAAAAVPKSNHGSTSHAHQTDLKPVRMFFTFYLTMRHGESAHFTVAQSLWPAQYYYPCIARELPNAVGARVPARLITGPGGTKVNR